MEGSGEDEGDKTKKNKRKKNDEDMVVEAADQEGTSGNKEQPTREAEESGAEVPEGGKSFSSTTSMKNANNNAEDNMKTAKETDLPQSTCSSSTSSVIGADVKGKEEEEDAWKGGRVWVDSTS